ncbi:MAG: 1-deoxy-D-xylulose-5-phosphate synthase, partial [Planctomycetes bacterium]|nr:1-deoxy-D-xylulose-5-phosphate synthase [Planctomycetota bacterium]
STFMQRGYDQIFQEMALQNLPVVLMLDRAGLTGPDGPTHHGMFDLTYLRPFPNMTVMAPGDAVDLPLMVRFALAHDGPTAIRYPKATAESVDRQPAAIELGRAETLRFGEDGTIIACGTLLTAAVCAADRLREEGLALGVVNARFVKPLDTQTILHAVEESPLVLTVEEGALMGGFGSAVLEAVSDARLDSSRIHRLGVPDRFVEHGSRAELLADLGLDEAGIARVCCEIAARGDLLESAGPDQTITGSTPG